uniref:Uncharacterized protein n=1 Tax=Oryza meridionalis TaxID=40149 RepID=A0A0E0CW98_9ORYZ
MQQQQQQPPFSSASLHLRSLSPFSLEAHLLPPLEDPSPVVALRPPRRRRPAALAATAIADLKCQRISAFSSADTIFMEATITQEEEFTQVSNKTTSSNPENMLLSSQGLPDNFTDEATKDQYLCNSGLQAANQESKKKNLTFLTKFQNRIIASLASESSPCRNAFRRPLLSREIIVREYVKLARIIRRTAAACFSPSSDADEDYDYLPHMQLDKVTHAISREAFGPLYLVT